MSSFAHAKSDGSHDGNVLETWRNRIRGIQSERVTPEVLERIQQSSVKHRRAEKAYKNAQFLERVNYVSSASNAVTLRSTSHAPPASAPTAYKKSSADFASRSNAIQSVLASSKVKASSRLNDESDDEEEEERYYAQQNANLERLEEELVSEGRAQQSDFLNNVTSPIITPFSAVGAAGSAAISADVHVLLEQFAVEPAEDTELTAKFLIFENFLNNVTEIRTQTLDFWEANKDQFVGASRAACEKDIRNIDSTDAMGIEDQPQYGVQKWFVHAMAIKANQNVTAITQVLAMLRSRLELLARDLGECPCCLDSLVEGTHTTLGCCHKVCTECWDNWVELKGTAAFCPLCKHQEFVEEIIGNT